MKTDPDSLTTLAAHLEKIGSASRGHGGHGWTYDDEVEMLQETAQELAALRAKVAELEQDKTRLIDEMHAILARATRSDSQACNTIERLARAAIDNTKT